MLAADPAGDDHVEGEALVPVNSSILFVPSTKGGDAIALTVTVYPLFEFDTTERSCAAIFGTPLESVPNGIVFAVELVTSIEAPFTLPVFAAATENVNVESTEAVTDIDVVVRIANATEAVSITVEPVSEYDVMRAKNVEFVVVGFVIPEKDTVTA